MLRVALVLIGLLAACAPIAPNESPAAPRPIAPLTGTVFVESDLLLRWDWQPLADDERYVVRLWPQAEQDDNFQEIWTTQPEAAAQSLIDAYSQATGDFYWQVAAIQTTTDGAFAGMVSEWSRPQRLTRLRRLPVEPLPVAQQSDAARYITARAESPADLIDVARDFVHSYSAINTDAPLDYAADYSDALSQMMAYANDEGEPPQLFCNGLSTAMHTVLRELGIESRLIFLYGEVPGYFAQHTFIEVFNPQTQAWEAHDPTYNVYFVDASSGQRATVARMVFGSLATVHTCDAAGTCQADTMPDLVRETLAAFRYGYTNEVWVNPDRIDISARFDGLDGRNLPELISERPHTLIFRFDNWERGSSAQ